MGSSDTRGAKPAYMYEVDEEGIPISGTKRSARETRHRPSISQKSRSEEKRQSRSDTTSQFGAMMSGARADAEMKLERRKSSVSTKSPSKSHTRPPSSHGTKSFQKVTFGQENPAHYGYTGATARVSPNASVAQYPQYQMAQPIPMRPRAVTSNTYPVRPVSYHAASTSSGYGPPLSASAFYQQPSLPTPSYPPPSPSYIRYAATPQQDYFSQMPVRPLAHRFGISDPIARTSSAYGSRDAPPHSPIHYSVQDTYEDGGYGSAEEAPVTPRKRASIRVPTGRRNSIIKKEKAEIVDYDREMMPPPPRPGILRNRTTEYYPDTTAAAPEPPRYRESSSTRRAPSAHRNSVSYDLGPENERVRVETANTSHRRQSYYGQSASTNVGSGATGSWEDKAREATNYQEDVGVGIPLTADALRRRHAASSRSTKSSGSRDESDYRKSATTRTTRSGSGEDNDFTIKVKGGQARVMVGGAQIDCVEGGEIEIKRQQKSIRNGSERSNSEYDGQSRIEDRRSRVDRIIGKSRRSGSLGGHSYTRSSPQYPMGQYT